MSAVATIAQKVSKYPQLQTIIEDRSITVTPLSVDGFPVSLFEKDSGYTVGFDGWHEEFDSEAEALEAFAFGLSEECRLKIVYRGSTACSWTCESFSDGEWREDSTTGLLLIPFWKKKQVVYRQNKIIK